MSELATPAEAKKDKNEPDYEAESALRTILEAKKIQKNADLMKRIKKIASEQAKEIRSIADLEEAYSEKVRSKDEGEENDE